MINTQVVEVLKGLPSVKSFTTIVGEAPLDRGNKELAISVETFNTVPLRSQLGGPSPYRTSTVEVGVHCVKMNDKGKHAPKKGMKPEDDTAYMLVMKDIQGLHQNIKPFRDLKPEFHIEAIMVNGPSPDASDEEKNYHKFRFEFVVDYNLENIPTPTSN